MYHIFCIHSSVKGHLGWFQLFTIVERTAINPERPLRTRSSTDLKETKPWYGALSDGTGKTHREFAYGRAYSE